MFVRSAACEHRDIALTVLIVDDDPGFRGVSARLIAAMGLTVVGEAEDAETAVAAAHRLRPDAALVDIRLPDRDGIDLGAELAALAWRPRVVLISSDRDAAPNNETSRLAFVAKEDLPLAPLRQLFTGD